MTENLWNVFAQVWLDVASGRPAEADIDRFDRALRRAGIDEWEVGPFDAEGKTSFIALVPAQGRGNRAIAERLVEGFPGYPNWIACLYRPPKHWTRIWRAKRGGELIDANAWRACFRPARSGGLDALVLMQPERLARRSEAINMAAFFLEAELGGRFMADALAGIDVLPLGASFDDTGLFTLEAIKAKWVP